MSRMDFSGLAISCIAFLGACDRIGQSPLQLEFMRFGSAEQGEDSVVSFAGKKAPPLEPGSLTDVFSNPSWLARKGAVLGLDVECTKAAVDLQNLSDATADAVIGAALETLRSAAGADCAFLVLLDTAGMWNRTWRVVGMTAIASFSVLYSATNSLQSYTKGPGLYDRPLFF
jgi:hypothetical protein